MTTLTVTERNDLRDDLYEAQEHMNEAIRLIERYVRATGDSYAEAYLLDHLRIFAGRGHGFLSDDMNIDDLIARLDERDDGDEDDEDDDEEKTTDPPAPIILSPTGYTLYWCASAGCYVTVPTDED